VVVDALLATLIEYRMSGLVHLAGHKSSPRSWRKGSCSSQASGTWRWVLFSDGVETGVMSGGRYLATMRATWCSWILKLPSKTTYTASSRTALVKAETTSRWNRCRSKVGHGSEGVVGDESVDFLLDGGLPFWSIWSLHSCFEGLGLGDYRIRRAATHNSLESSWKTKREHKV